ncbi:hypothetical protein [Neobacillus sp. DY30]|nr:hypothetical protein [Neobacillus sp. DY30]WHX98043.1 hypothetical protein QNH29_15320 [Neobacillus sp. DY30]
MSRFKVVFENTIQSGGFSLEQYLITLHQEKICWIHLMVMMITSWT